MQYIDHSPSYRVDGSDIVPQKLSSTRNSVFRLPTMLLDKKGWQWVGLQYLALGIVAQLLNILAQEDDWLLHGLWCIAGMIPTLVLVAKVLHSNMLITLIDHRVIATISFASFYLIGASLLAFGSEDQINHSISAYPCDARLALRIDAMNAIGLGITLIVSTFTRWRWLSKQTDRVVLSTKAISPLATFMTLMAVGAFATYKMLLQDFGLSGEQDISGTWRTLSNFTLVAIFVGTSYRGKYKSSLLIMSIFAAIVLSFTGVLLFNKTAILTPLATMILGFSVRYGAAKIIPVSITFIILIFSVLGGAVDYGRLTLSPDMSHPQEERWEVFKEGITAASNEQLGEKYSLWARYCLLPSQAAAIDFYDMGIGGDDYKLIPWVFVPRFIAPNKPIMTNSGVEFYYKITGHYGSSTAQGVYASGYYNLGWLGVVLAAGICGGSISLTSAIAYVIFARRSFMMLPFALAGFNMAYAGMGGNFVSSYIGFLPFLLFPLLFASAMLSLSRS